MADVRRSINTRIWSDEWFETLKPTERLLWLYLLTNERTNMLGCYEVSMRRISYESGLDESMVRKAFEGFERAGKAYYLCGKYVFLPNWLKNQSMNTNMVKSARVIYETLPDSVLSAIVGMVGEGFESLSKGLQILPKIEIESEMESEGEKERETNRDFEDAWIAYQRKGAKKTALREWLKVSKDERLLIAESIPAYIASTEPKYRKDFERYISSGKYYASMSQAPEAQPLYGDSIG